MFSVSGEELWRWRQNAVGQVEDAVCHPPDRLDYLQELDWLLTAIAPLDRFALRLESYRRVPQLQLQRSLSELSELWRRRLEQRVPVQYLLGQTTWRNLTLTVTSGVLIPRPETELLIDLAQDWISAHPSLHQNSPMQWADLGTGSGAIALGLAQSFPTASVHAVDLSSTALKIAQQNAEQLQLTEAVSFYLGEWLNPLSSLEHSLDGILSNPPYIPRSELSTLQPEVFEHEPELALDGGADGLESIRQIVKQSPLYLKKGGLILMEIMRGQSASVKAILQNNGLYCNIQIHLDLAGVERFASATRI